MILVFVVATLLFAQGVTLGAAQPVNDACSASTVVSSLPFAVGETTTGATSDFAETTCDITTAGRGVWYTFVGTGKVVRAEYFDLLYNPEMSIFTGTCLSLVCLSAGNENSVEWIAEAGVTYYILLTGNSDLDTGTYSFTLDDYNIPANDECVNAVSIGAGGLPDSAGGTTLGALPDFDVTTCAISPDARGVWYSFIGTGTVARADYFDLSYNPEMSLFTGSCGSLVCESAGNEGSMEWIAEVGVTYYILLSGNSFDSVGSFSLELSDSQIPANDECTNAIALANPLPASDSGTTVGALPDFNVINCAIPPDARGVWYTYIGTGKVVRLEYFDLSYNPEVSLFTGTCRSLVCLSPGNEGLVEWIAESGVTYYILLSGNSFTQVGSYSLELSEYQIPANDECENAIESIIPSNEVSFAAGGVTTGALPDFDVISCAIPTEARGVWYSYVGEESVVVASYSNLAYNPEMSVFRGECNSLSCLIAGAEGEASWIAKQGETYYILLSGNGFAAVGSYSFTLESLPVPSNSVCDGAITISGFPFEYDGDLTGALNLFETDRCDIAASGRGVWFVLFGTGNKVRIEVTSSFTKELSLFQGSCGSLLCENVNSGAASGACFIEWTTVPGVVYYIVLAGTTFTQVGTYQLDAFNVGATVAPNPTTSPTLKPVTAEPLPTPDNVMPTRRPIAEHTAIPTGAPRARTTEEPTAVPTGGGSNVGGKCPEFPCDGGAGYWIYREGRAGCTQRCVSRQFVLQFRFLGYECGEC